MAIKAYIGRMGSGKSYEVVSHVILNSLRRGRRVVSNIAGLNYAAMLKLLEEDGVEADEVGELVTVTHDQVLEENFFRTDADNELGKETFVKPGDLVALDEIWRFWKPRGEIPPRHMNFFRMHRHFADEATGRTCEVALITQQVTDINTTIRGVIEETYRMTKHTAIGSTKRYRIDIFQGDKVRGAPLRQLQRTYDPRFFPLYSSHSQAQGDGAKEESVDERGNILKGALFKVVLPLMVLLGIVAVWAVMRVFTPPTKPATVAENKGDPKAAGAAVPAPVAEKKPASSEAWRVLGWWQSGGALAVAMVGEADRLRVVYNPPNVQLQGMMVSVQLPDKDFATTYGGPGLAAGFLGQKR